MSKESAMSLLGLSLSTEGKKKMPKQVTDYSEDELLVAWRETWLVRISLKFSYTFFYSSIYKMKVSEVMNIKIWHW